MGVARIPSLAVLQDSIGEGGFDGETLEIGFGL